MSVTPQEWLRRYALLALRLDRRLPGSATGTVLIYQGPPQWRVEVEREEQPPVRRLVDDADELLAHVPFAAGRAEYLAAHVRAMRAVARSLVGPRPPLPQFARECLGIAARPLPEDVFDEAHARLDRALPPGPGTLADRLHAWQAAHTLPAAHRDRLPALLDRAVAETRRRTSRLVALPEGEVVRCRLESGVGYRAAGEYEGDLRATLHVNGDLPFNLADLLYVVAHEGHPGHIAESLLKDRRLAAEQGHLEQRIRFLLSPSFVLSEGLGLHAEEIIFPGDEAQAWLTDNVLAEVGIAPDDSDFATVHRVQNVLFGVWANAAHLAAEGRPEAEVAAYLRRWALLSEAETAGALATLRATGMDLYVLGYHHGWELLDRWLADDRAARVRRLLTEQLLPADLASA
ncbi:hypothetical protein [Micromonospora globbae]|uniref:hypothetical protein n=1 Tax=Micromonospora globbae TaxID=1894969 RepID=UPI00342C2C89|nr:hypothetical protein OH732_16170 [Micromonospora globbae]